MIIGCRVKERNYIFSYDFEEGFTHNMLTYILDLEEELEQSRQRKGSDVPGRKIADVKAYK